MSKKFVVTILVLFVLLFGFSVIAVNYVRAVNFSSENNKQTSAAALESAQISTAVLFLDRWVGIEGVMAISSYSNKGWSLWRTAWQEKYSENETTFYDLNIIESPYKNTDKQAHHFVSLPGIVAFFFYPGSFLFLFFCMFLMGMFAAVIEFFAFRLSGNNVILCALLAQVIAFRYASFGYVPAQSYLLFGTIVLNIILIYILNKFLTCWHEW